MSSSNVPQLSPTLHIFPKTTRHHQHVIECVMPCREVHILAGASGAGKTSLIVQMIDDLTEGNDLFGL